MAKYSQMFKFKVVLDHFKNGLGSRSLSCKYNIKAHSDIENWINQYKAYGFKGLVVKSPKKDYSGDYKVKVLNWRHSHHESYSRTALHFNISNPATICSWELKMEARGIVGLYTQRGPHKMKSNWFRKYKQAQSIGLTGRIKYVNERLKFRHHNKLTRIRIIKDTLYQVSLSKILRSLKIPRSTYYYDKNCAIRPNRDKYILHQIKEIKSAHHNLGRNMGYRPITVHLNLKLHNIRINHKRVLRIMKAYGLTSKAYNKRTRKYNSYKGDVGRIAPNILGRNFNTNHPYRKLTTDVSEFPYGCGDCHHKVYLSPVMDLYSDEILSFTISKHPTVEFTLKPLRKALNKRPKGLKYRTIVHSDQGFQYQNIRWRFTLRQYQAIQSMSRKGTCLDNSQMESFFHIMKDEMMDKHYQTEGQLVKAMKEWIYYYNHYRLKEKLDWKSPIQYQQLTV